MLVRILQNIKKAIALLKSKPVERVAIWTITCFTLMGGFFGVYAQDQDDPNFGKVNCDTALFQDGLKAVNTITEDDATNNFNATYTTGGSTICTGMLVVAPGNVVGSERLSASGVSPLSQGGLIGAVENNVMAFQNNPPSMDVQYAFASDWIPNYGEKTAAIYAQDSGYDFLLNTGISDLWGKSRAISYAVFVIVLIVAGFMVMFRHKIGGQLAVTVFNTIPSVIVGLILVTFSFYIVGLMVNFGAILVNVTSGFLNVNSIVVDGPFSLFGVFVRGFGTPTAGTIGAGAFTAIIGNMLAGIAGAGIFAFAAGALGVVGLIGVLIGLVIVAIVAYASIKVYITLIKAYVGILIDTVLGPIIITLSVIPGQDNMKFDWFRRVTKNVLTFPGVFLIVNLGIYIITTDLNIAFPSSLAGGGTGAGNGNPAVNELLKGVVCIYLFHLAADVPKFLDDFLPINGGKNAGEAFKGAAKSAFGRIPIVGGAFG